MLYPLSYEGGGSVPTSAENPVLPGGFSLPDTAVASARPVGTKPRASQLR